VISGHTGSGFSAHANLIQKALGICTALILQPQTKGAGRASALR
jgi:hypothetical protein